MESSKSESQDIRVKLCGREFIRMVVTSCGSSRLKRNAPDSGSLYTKPHSRFTFFRHSFELYTYVFFVLCLILHFYCQFFFQEVFKTCSTGISLHTRNGPQPVKRSSGRSLSPLEAWPSIPPPTWVHQQRFWYNPQLCRMSACRPEAGAMSGRRACAAPRDALWVN